MKPETMLVVIALVLAGATTSPCNAQKGGNTKKPATRSASASIEGDVYFVTKSGDVKRVAGNSVRLFADGPDLRAVLDSSCAAITQYATEMRSDSLLAEGWKLAAVQADAIGGTAARKIRNEAESTMVASIRELETVRARRDQTVRATEDSITKYLVATAPTGMNAHYRFSDVKLGEYVLIVSTTVEQYHYQWLTALSVSQPLALTRDLDNSVLSDAPNYCIRR